MRFFLACLAVTFFLSFFTGTVYAKKDYGFSPIQNGEVKEALSKTVPVRFLPGNPLYYFIIAKEAVSRFFKPSSVERAKFDFTLSGKRLKETYLLINRGDLKNASNNLARYAQINSRLVGQIEKARSQNQAVQPIVDELADELKFQEDLLITINQLWQGDGNNYGFDDNFSKAIDSFREVVAEIDNLKPGVNNRFEIIKVEESTDSANLAKPSPTPTPIEATPSYHPKRIIY